MRARLTREVKLLRLSGVSEFFRVKVLENKEIAEGTFGLWIEKPKNFDYKAGQFVMVRIKESARAMSLASAPFEENLLLAMRESDSEFKKAARELKPGDELEIQGPFGRLTMEDESEPVVFIGGGIGITPFRGMVLEQEKKSWPAEIILFYSSHTVEAAPFLDEFQNIKSEKFKFFFFATRETGRINAEMLKKNLSDPARYSYYIVGLPEMVLEVKRNVESLGVRKEKIKVEHFSGHQTPNKN